MNWLQKICPLLIGLHLFACIPKATADTFDKDISNFISTEGTILYLGTGVALPLLINGKEGKQKSLRTLDSFGTSALLCIGIKKITQVKRPDSNSRDSFPSCHSTAAFAVATMQSHYNPDTAILWYSGASLIAYSRLNLNRHRISEVLTGAALGYLTARLELNQKRGLILFPLIHNNEANDTVVGLQIVGSF